MSHSVRYVDDFGAPVEKPERDLSMGQFRDYREIDVHENGKAKGSTKADCLEMNRMGREQELKVSIPLLNITPSRSGKC